MLRQLAGIGGGRSLGFGPNRVRSLPDGVAQVLDEYLQSTEDQHSEAAAHTPGMNGNGTVHEIAMPVVIEQPPLLKIGDLCPECGQASVVNEEGCRKCYSCGFSEC